MSTDLVLGVAASLSALGLGYATRKAWIRVPTVAFLTPKDFAARKKFRAVVVSVGDGDNFRAYHLPLLRSLSLSLSGKGTDPKALMSGKKLSEETLSIRIAGVDAPECAHFGQPGQPHGPSSRSYLRSLLHGRRVCVEVLRKDQYDRAVALAWMRYPLFGDPLVHSRHTGDDTPYDTSYRPTFLTRLLGTHASLELTRAGYATLYTSQGAEYGSPTLRHGLEAAERQARTARRGMWTDGPDPESPMAFKRRMKDAGSAAGVAGSAGSAGSEGEVVAEIVREEEERREWEWDWDWDRTRRTAAVAFGWAVGVLVFVATNMELTGERRRRSRDDDGDDDAVAD